MSDSVENRRYFLRKEERLRSKIAFEYIFEHGSRFSAGVLRFFYASDLPPHISKVPLAVAVTAPKRNFKKAVDRNLLKRRMREAFRLNKHILLPELKRKDKNLVVLIKYNIRTVEDYHSIEKSMIKGLRRLGNDLENLQNHTHH